MMVCVSCYIESSKGWCIFLPWGMTRAQPPQLALKQHPGPQTFTVAHSLNWQPVRYLGVNLLSATCSFEKGTLQAGAKLRWLSDWERRSTALRPSIRAQNSPHASHGGFLGLLWVAGIIVQTPYIFQPKGHCRNLLCGLASTAWLVGVVLVLLACLQ